jgi:hypothetical protein
MSTFAYPNRGTSFVGSTVLLLAVAGTSYVAGALLHDPVRSPGISPTYAGAAFASPLMPDVSLARDPVPTTVEFPMATAETGQFDGERIVQPRECDLVNGVSTACLFMD